MGFILDNSPMVSFNFVFRRARTVNLLNLPDRWLYECGYLIFPTEGFWLFLNKEPNLNTCSYPLKII